MDILFTILASVLLLVGFLVICRSSDDDEEDETEDELTHDPARRDKTENS
ncbi:exported hypothetical protein [Nitrospina gracilis 3/211]|uniref:Uncharacterized protein n=1 Tax=Nitrospina gracilis (strain 3/211) TaxID=1266370 RepID=M1YUM7_NITG3|nr:MULTISPECIES: hypothetical protein [Nitrospina]MCF8720084.1 hypothetical protein [Nitrospina gracilis Nb-211]MCF8722104.1 hypothetical protein [Nitrospina sp. Nb-3]CCQ89293.1 exported hypothetical protein [Nitrospina gracilis 3/211]